MTTILILSCGTRNKLVRFFKEAFHSLPGGGRVIVTDCSPWLAATQAPALYEADAFYLVPPMKDPGYEDRILEICMREQVNALLPLFEDELDLLAQNRKKFEEKGITAIVSDAESVAVCRDKYGFFSLLQKNGLPVLYTSASLEEFDSDYAEGKIAFPVFVKPVRGCGSVGISRVDNRDGFYKLRGYSIYYERNQMMQDYMISRKDISRVETGVNDRAIQDFRQKMEEHRGVSGGP